MSIVLGGASGGGSAPSGPTPVYYDSLPFGADYLEATYPSPTQEFYDYKVGGASGTIVKSVNVQYVDAFKDNILNITLV
jgi:hypothetical protein